MNSMRIVAISLGGLTQLTYKASSVETGIYKHPVDGPVEVFAEGLLGDLQVDRKHHGGVDKAVYVYSIENRDYWAEHRKESAYPPGHFGENLTVTDMPDERIHIGDVFSVGACLMQVTQPRVPCFKLGIKFGDPGFVADFLTSGRTGFYLRVLKPGVIQAGDAIQWLSGHPDPVSIRDAMRALVKGPQQQDWIRKVLAQEALSEAWRQDLTERQTID